jgi:hypothetical protein
MTKHIKPDVESFARIRVVGVGGSGGNAVNHMVDSNVQGVDFIAINTDAQDLHKSKAMKKIHIGKSLTRGLGTAIIPTFVLTPLTYLGGVFYSINLLPAPWRSLSLANPILYLVNGFRYGFLGITDVSIGYSIALLVILCAALLAFALFLFRKGYALTI